VSKSRKTHIGSRDDKTWKADKFWEEYDFIVCAVNSTKARLEIDKMCILHQKTMLDCGMKGAQASTQVIIPFKSQTYGESNDTYDSPFRVHDRVHTFPQAIEDCIVWAQNHISREFFQPFELFQEYSKDPQRFIQEIKEAYGNRDIDDYPYQLRDLKKILQIPCKVTPELCLQYAIQLFEEQFSTCIIKLFANFNPDKIQENGKPFWKSGRNCPKVLTLDPEDETHASFILSTANLYAKMFDLPLFTDNFATAQQAKSITLSQNIQAITTKECIQILETRKLSSFPKIIEMKENRESKLQLDFISTASILRARIYSIEEAPLYKISMVAGDFSPALITTATTITGALSLELFKLTLNQGIQMMRNMFLNLEVPMYVCSEPAEPTKTEDKEYHNIFMGPVKAFPSAFTPWDTIDIKGPMTVLEILQYFKKKYGIKISILCSSSTMLYNTFMPQGGNYFLLPPDGAFNLRSEEKITPDSKCLILEASAEGPNDEYDILLPTIRYFR